MVEPEEVANLVAFLSGAAGDKITGQAISICGGSTQA
jgi:NAD(P)-dependent dehydrogenase (short-subunit alcohol dehydrogenase family)